MDLQAPVIPRLETLTKGRGPDIPVAIIARSCGDNLASGIPVLVRSWGRGGALVRPSDRWPRSSLVAMDRRKRTRPDALPVAQFPSLSAFSAQASSSAFRVAAASVPPWASMRC